MPAAAAGRDGRCGRSCARAGRCPDEVDLDLVAGGDAADQVAPGSSHRLRHRQDRRDVVAGMRVVGGEERVVHVELAHRGAVRPGRPFGADALAWRHAEHRRAVLARMASAMCARATRPGRRVDRGDRHRGVVDDAVDDHRGDVALDARPDRRRRRRSSRRADLRAQALGRFVGTNCVGFHGAIVSSIACGSPASACRLRRLRPFRMSHAWRIRRWPAGRPLGGLRSRRRSSTSGRPARRARSARRVHRSGTGSWNSTLSDVAMTTEAACVACRGNKGGLSHQAERMASEPCAVVIGVFGNTISTKRVGSSVGGGSRLMGKFCIDGILRSPLQVGSDIRNICKV